MGLTLELLGPPSIEVDGAPLDVDTRKAVAMLCLLAVRGDRMPRDGVADLLWPSATPDRARASLRRTLSVLTSALDDRWVQADRASVWLAPDADLTCDVTTFRAGVTAHRVHATEVHGAGQGACPACLPALRDAAASYTGPFLDGFVLRDAPRFDDWVGAEDEALRRDVATVLEALSAGQAAAGQRDDALATARRWLALDPLHEEAHRSVMRLAAAAGRRDEAVRQYRECVAVLDRELGVAPLPETTALYAALLEDTAPEPAPAVPRPVPLVHLPDVADHPLVDRDEELETLRRAHAGLHGGVACVVLEGEAGIGKTRVASEYLEFASARGAPAVLLRCREAESRLTCGPFVDLFRDALAHDTTWLHRLPRAVLAELARIVPEVVDAVDAVPPTPPLDSPGAKARFLDGLFAAMATLVAGGDQPGLVVVDDLHWADPTTVDVLVRGLHRHGGPLLLLLTWRTELVPHDDPVRRAVRGTGTTTITLPRLDADQVAELVGEVRPQLAELADRLYEETEGIPFFVVEYLATLEDDDWELPSGVLDLLAARLAPLDQLARQCLGAAAVLGRSFDLALLVRTSGRSEDEVVAGLEELVARRLVEERAGRRGGEVRYDFTHTKLREVAYDTASLARRRLLHRRAAEAIAARSGDDPAAASRIARHFALAGREAEAAEHLVAAGEHARSLYAHREAVEHFEAALALGHPDLARLHGHLGDLHALAGRYTEAAAAYDLAGAHTVADTDLARIEHRTGRLHLRRGAWARAVHHLDRALELLAEDGGCHVPRVRADRAVASARLGDVDTAAAEAEAAVAEAEACGDTTAIALARNTAGLVARRRGRPDTALGHLAVALAATETLDDPTARVAVLNNLALARAADGDLDGAFAHAEAALDLCVELGDVHREAALHNNVADLLHEAGRTDEAMPHLKESARLLADVGEPRRPEPEIWKLTDW